MTAGWLSCHRHSGMRTRQNLSLCIVLLVQPRRMASTHQRYSAERYGTSEHTYSYSIQKAGFIAPVSMPQSVLYNVDLRKWRFMKILLSLL